MSPDRPEIRVVFDCMVFLQGAARRESASGACLLLVELEAVELCLSQEILPYINLAIAAGASYLVSRDNDVLDLAKLSNPDGGRLRSHTPHLQILDPVSFLAEARRRLQKHGSLGGLEATGVPPLP